jgi:hypothetical protein
LNSEPGVKPGSLVTRDEKKEEGAPNASRRAASLSIIGAIQRRQAKISGDSDDEYRGRNEGWEEWKKLHICMIRA